MGSGLVHPHKIRRKMGDIGAVGGYWHDTGYVGLPCRRQPVLAVYSWPTYDDCFVLLGARCGGRCRRPPTIAVNNEANSCVVCQRPTATTPSHHLSHCLRSTKYNIYVWAASFNSARRVAGSDPRKIVMGKPAVTTSHHRRRKPGHVLGDCSHVNGYKDQPVGVAVPTSVR